MKTSVTLALIILAVVSAVFASSQESIQARLVRVEMDYFSGIASGMTPNHPKMKELKAELDALNQQPNIRKEEYYKLLNEQRIHIQVDLATLAAKGYGSTHPEVVKTKAKADAIENLLKQKS